MKSAYELAMERLEKQSPTATLTEAQKQEISEIDSIYKAKIAERELLLNGEIEKAKKSGDFGELETIQKQLASDRRRFQEECEEKKAAVRKR
ncbi:MAG: hypothetical protein QM796_02665 [Chthoniobacteraceae bacterium]